MGELKVLSVRLCKPFSAHSPSGKGALLVKHAAGCHKDYKLSGEADTFIEDDAFHRLKEYEAANSRQE